MDLKDGAESCDDFFDGTFCGFFKNKDQNQLTLPLPIQMSDKCTVME